MATLEHPRTAEQALHQHGLTGERLLKLAHRIATDAQHRAPAGLGGKYEDLVMFLCEQACVAAIRYDPTTSGNGYTFSSYLCDVMELRITDFYRRKGEGFGDRRTGSDNRITLTANTDDFDTDIDFEQLVSERRACTWHQAANTLNLPFTTWVVQTLDQAAARQLKRAA